MDVAATGFDKVLRILWRIVFPVGHFEADSLRGIRLAIFSDWMESLAGAQTPNVKMARFLLRAGRARVWCSGCNDGQLAQARERPEHLHRGKCAANSEIFPTF